MVKFYGGKMHNEKDMSTEGEHATGRTWLWERSRTEDSKVR